MIYWYFFGTIIAFVISAALCPVFIPFLQKLKFGQYIREEGPESHLKKAGTPTMGGIVILIAAVVPMLLALMINKALLPVLLMMLAFGVIGFIDDYIKVVLKRSMGFRAWQKMLCEIIVAVAFTVYIMKFTAMGTMITIPFAGVTVDLGYWFIPFALIAILGTVNGANFTDGLDGLASSVTAVICIFFIGVSFLIGSALGIGACAMLGALMGFLIFNAYPAKVFMGDTGSLALGGFVAAMAFMLNMPLFIVFIAVIYLIEIVSVIMQVSYFKLTHGKRIFKMTPIHHHFELSGFSETRVNVLFVVITIIGCLAAFVGYFGFIGL